MCVWIGCVQERFCSLKVEGSNESVKICCFWWVISKGIKTSKGGVNNDD